MKQLGLFLTLFPCLFAEAQDSTFIKVHFLYGSTPKKEFRPAEKTWFGGKLGGHVGVEADSGRIINFVPSGEFHKFPKKDFHSSFVLHSVPDFWRIFGGSGFGEKDDRRHPCLPCTEAETRQHCSGIHCPYPL